MDPFALLPCRNRPSRTGKWSFSCRANGSPFSRSPFPNSVCKTDRLLPLSFLCEGRRVRSPCYQKFRTPSNRNLRMWRTSTPLRAMRGLSSGEPPQWSRHAPVPGKYDSTSNASFYSFSLLYKNCGDEFRSLYRIPHGAAFPSLLSHR